MTSRRDLHGAKVFLSTPEIFSRLFLNRCELTLYSIKRFMSWQHGLSDMPGWPTGIDRDADQGAMARRN